MKWQETKLTDFKNLQLPTTPNYCLVCPNCNGKLQIKAPQFTLSTSELQQKWNTMIAQQPRVKLIKHEGDRYRYVQRSKVFRFPDIIDVEFIKIDATHSSLNALSRSVYGYSDFGVNYDRLKSWITILTQL